MKRIMIILAMAAMAAMAGAQVRTVKMPVETPKKTLNTAETEEGYWCAIDVEAGGTLMEGMKNLGIVAVNFSNGYRVSQWVKVGVGIGAQCYINNDDVRYRKQHMSMSIFATARGNMLSESSRRTVPFWQVNIGGVLPDGFLMAPGVGLRIGEKRSAFTISLNYTVRHLRSYRTDTYHGAALKLGYEF